MFKTCLNYPENRCVGKEIQDLTKSCSYDKKVDEMQKQSKNTYENYYSVTTQKII